MTWYVNNDEESSGCPGVQNGASESGSFACSLLRNVLSFRSTKTRGL